MLSSPWAGSGYGQRVRQIRSLHSGVSQIVLFNGNGDTLCDRLIFTGKNDFFDIKAKTGKPVYIPHELVEMEIFMTDREANPVHATFSLSIRDGANEVESNHTVVTDLLLMSEIKGFVRNPSYYFEDNDDVRRAALDVLLMVQGWRRYSWKQMAGVEPFELKYLPEQGIETNGNVVAYNMFGRQVSKPKVDVGLLLQKNTENDDMGGSFVETFETDDQGRFSFVSDVEGRWNMILNVKEKGKVKNYRIILDRVFNPEPKRYRYADLQVNIAEKNHIPEDDFEEDTEEDWDSFPVAYQDSLAKLGIDEKVHYLEEVTVTARRRTRAQDIYQNRSTSVAYYDVASEYDDLYDRGKYIGDNIHELLKNMHPDFTSISGRSGEVMFFQGKAVLFVVNYERVDMSSSFDVYRYKNIRLQAIKSIYINETVNAFCQYTYHPSPFFKCTEVSRNWCIVFIETYPEGEISVDGAKGIRKTWLEGYSAVNDFYHPDYLTLPPAPDDYRRTLYWNPSVTPDETGHASVQFYNNSRSMNFHISAETVTPVGIIGIYRDD